MFGIAGRLPVAITAFLNRSSLRVAIVLVRDDRNGTSSPANVGRPEEDVDAKRSQPLRGISRGEVRTPGSQTSHDRSEIRHAQTTGSRARRPGGTSATTRADRSIAFDGTQPVLRQSPPRRRAQRAQRGRRVLPRPPRTRGPRSHRRSRRGRTSARARDCESQRVGRDRAVDDRVRRSCRPSYPRSRAKQGRSVRTRPFRAGRSLRTRRQVERRLRAGRERPYLSRRLSDRPRPRQYR